MPSPTLSAVLLNYNHGRYLPESLGAILAQDYVPKQVIVVDDGSTDDSAQILDSFRAKAPHLVVARHEANRGVVAALRTGVERATGDYLYLGAADDRVLPGFFAKSMSLLAAHPGAGLCCAGAMTFGHHARARWLHKAAGAGRFLPPDRVAADIASIDGIAVHTAVVHRQAFLDAGGYLPDLRWNSDWFAYHVVAFRHGLCHVPETLALWRLDEGSFSTAGGRDPAARRAVVERVFDLLESDAYRDVAPRFTESGVLGGLGPDAVLLARERGLPWRPMVSWLKADDYGALLAAGGDRDFRAAVVAEWRADGPRGMVAVPALAAATADPDPGVRRAAVLTIARVVWDYSRVCRAAMTAAARGLAWAIRLHRAAATAGTRAKRR